MAGGGRIPLVRLPDSSSCTVFYLPWYFLLFLLLGRQVEGFALSSRDTGCGKGPHSGESFPQTATEHAVAVPSFHGLAIQQNQSFPCFFNSSGAAQFSRIHYEAPAFFWFASGLSRCSIFLSSNSRRNSLLDSCFHCPSAQVNYQFTPNLFPQNLRAWRFRLRG